MGILNVTPDSFYDGGRYDTEKEWLKQAEKMLGEGADIIDIGVVSTRPGTKEYSAKEEMEKLLPVLKSVKKKFPGIIISVDTYRSGVAEASADNGADMINDISGGTLDEKMFEIIAKLNLPYILMHIQGSPENMQKNPVYDDVVREIITFFSSQLNKLKKFGINDVIIDPGFGFGKTLDHNYTILGKLEMFRIFELPLLVGVSRKSMINKLLNISPDEALNGTTALNTIALLKGASILRVHDVKEAVQCVRIVEKLNGVT